MEAVKETTGPLFPAHTYLLDGTNLVAYIRVGTVVPFYFKSPIKGFSRTGRKFVKADTSMFKVLDTIEESRIIEVPGSKGEIYRVDPREHTCTCQGFTYRGTCKHVRELEPA